MTPSLSIANDRVVMCIKCLKMSSDRKSLLLKMSSDRKSFPLEMSSDRKPFLLEMSSDRKSFLLKISSDKKSFLLRKEPATMIWSHMKGKACHPWVGMSYNVHGIHTPLRVETLFFCC